MIPIAPVQFAASRPLSHAELLTKIIQLAKRRVDLIEARNVVRVSVRSDESRLWLVSIITNAIAEAEGEINRLTELAINAASAA